MTEKQKFMRVFVGGCVLNLVLMGSGLAFYLFSIRPAYENLVQTSQELIDLEQKEKSLWSAAQEMERRNGDLTRVDAAFLDLDNAITFITLLETIASRTGVSVSIRSATKENTANVNQADFTVSITGHIENIMQFIDLTENIPYFASVDDLAIVSPNEGIANANLLLTVFIP